MRQFLYLFCYTTRVCYSKGTRIWSRTLQEILHKIFTTAMNWKLDAEWSLKQEHVVVKSKCNQPRHWTFHMTRCTTMYIVQLPTAALHKHALASHAQGQQWDVSSQDFLLQSVQMPVSQSTSHVTFQTVKTARPGTLDHGEEHRSPQDRPGGALTSVNVPTDSTDLTVLTCRSTVSTGAPSDSCWLYAAAACC